MPRSPVKGRPSDAELVSLLASVDARDRKDGLQAICEALEDGYELRLENNLLLAGLIAAQRNSSDEVLRRWFYKYVGLGQATAYLPVLLTRASAERDPQTIAWLIGAVVALMGLEEALDHLRNAGVNEDLLVHAPTFGAYFLPELRNKNLVGVVTTDEDALLRRWASFLSSRWRESELQEYVKELNQTEDPEIAEFSVWSMTRSSGRLVDTRLEPDRIPNLPSQVRRWAYHLIAADREARLAYFDLIADARSSEREERVREGLATGLVRSPLTGPWLDFTAEWASEETSPRVERILMRALAKGRRGSRSHHVFATRRQRARSPIPERAQRTMFGVNRIDSSRREMVYFFAIDTVSFSEASDSDQLSIVTSLLTELAGQTELLSVPGGNVITLFTGDGVIIGIRGAENALAPLRSAVALHRKLQTVYRYEARFGLNCGSVYLLAMSDGSTQMIGHAINQTVRVMGATPANTVAMSEAYYTEVLHQGREPFPGYTFARRESEDKHGNALMYFDVLEVRAT